MLAMFLSLTDGPDADFPERVQAVSGGTAIRWKDRRQGAPHRPPREERGARLESSGSLGETFCGSKGAALRDRSTLLRRGRDRVAVAEFPFNHGQIPVVVVDLSVELAEPSGVKTERPAAHRRRRFREPFSGFTSCHGYGTVLIAVHGTPPEQRKVPRPSRSVRGTPAVRI